MKILIIDDTPATALLISEILRILGHQTTKVATGEQALELLKTQNFDVAVLDIELPGIKGWEVAKKIRYDMSLPMTLIAATSYFKEEADNVFDTSAFDAFISPPFTADKFRSILDK